MRKMLLAVLLVVGIAGIALAQQPQKSYIGLYCDENHDIRCVTGIGMYEVDMWIWCLPSYLGLTAVEFAMDYPAGVIPGTAERNPLFVTQIGDLSSEEGVATAGSECQTDWIWVFRQTLHITSDDPMQVRLEGSTLGNFVYDWPIHTSCEEDFPIYHLYALNYLYINYSAGSVECAMLETDNRSWGAIKSLFRE